ncbi:islet cell autoantigen 1 [Brienomyrus brachyistius]|uniref:islet cell autoantigen 1 n=1 Tax=Brienomyrus brachyistius TaxID=42636 RepID=UPI0020B28017|nr:islet cell autoantigen 1 [Brienomyrus brachyistius]XP_048883066.1 islet cell autoantigen 1 [Brienomyrus brachyistius]XP_048883067.1 islet cell autoantigen 1 [Brienomyrus brachyistius]
MEGWNYGHSREYYDRFVQSQDSSVVNKFQQKYWKTKQTLIKVTGKKEDEHVVASDADLDAKLEVFHSIQRTCMELLKVIEQYQRRICFLSQEENELGRFLRSQGSQDRTRAGKIMQATGKALCFSSQQRLSLRSPLCRLYQEVETFRYRAISDTWLTVNRMEQSRTEYRGALLWMKDVSQELDPDTYKQMEKFRKVQAQVRLTKTGFDKLKNDVCQKVDLLGASRCNLLSHVLTTYQTTLLHFWEKTSHTMAAIHESFKGYQPYEFTTLKTLQDPMNKLMDQEARRKGKKKTKGKPEEEEKPSDLKEELASIDDENHNKGSDQAGEVGAEDSLEQNFFEDVNASQKQRAGTKDLLSDYLEAEGGQRDEMALLNEILNSSTLDEGDFSKEWREVFGEEEPTGTSSMTGMAGAPPEEESSCFLPSQLLDQNMNNLQSSFADWSRNVPQSTRASTEQSAEGSQNPSKPTGTLETSKDLSTWFSLFADLDPLANPDAVGKTDKEHELLNA